MEAHPRKKSAKEVKSTPSSSSSSSCFIENLPNQVLMEILCRVPVKTLTTSKSVCKSWLNLIKHPQFCKLHQRRSPTKVCLQPYHGGQSTVKLHLGNFDFPNNLDPCHFEIPNFSVMPNNVPDYEDVKGSFILSNSCNGLLCYYSEDPSYMFAMVWNPCTSEFITFPPSPSPCHGYGLGFSRKENKFKLLRLMGGSGPSDLIVADICTIEKLCSWKRVDPCSSYAWYRDEHMGHVERQLGVFLQGTLHWLGIDRHGSSFAIYTFDFEDDLFGTLPLPPETYSHAIRGDRLGVLGGCLFVTDSTNYAATIWLMREYGVQASWTKLFVLEYRFSEGLDYKFCRPVTYMDNGEIVMRCTSNSSYNSSIVFVYNPVLKRVKVIGSGPPGSRDLRVIAYKPSLLLLKDSMLGYDVHVKPKCAGLKQGQISTTLDWWTPMKYEWRPLRESRKQHGSKVPLIDDELSDAQVGEGREGHESSDPEESSDGATSEASASEESSDGATSESLASEGGISEERRFHLMNKMSLRKVVLMREMKELKHRREMEELKHRREMVELKQRDKELEHRDMELKHRGKILDQRDKLLDILQELDNTDQSRMTADELDRHQSKIKRYENLVARTFYHNV